MSTKHTPGPWKAGPPATGLNPSEHRYIHAGGELVARASAGYAPNHRLAGQLDANARLIAAAPELLAAAKAALDFISSMPGDMGELENQLATAIDKAEGVL